MHKRKDDEKEQKQNEIHYLDFNCYIFIKQTGQI